MKRHILGALALAFAFGTLTSGAATAQTAATNYPVRPLQLIVPFPAGGSTDQLARILGQIVSEQWGQPVVVENKAGATGALASDYVLRQPADGHTLLMATASTHVVLPAFRKDLPYNVLRDFAPVTLLQIFPNMLVVNPTKVKAGNVQELIAHMKANPGKLSFASSGVGGSSHFAGELFKIMTGTEMVHVPYRGSAPAMNDLVAGNVDMIIDNLPGVWPHVQSGKLKALGVGGPKATDLASGVPAIADTVPGFEAQSWNGLVVRAGTPPEVVEKIAKAFNDAVKRPDIREKLIAAASEPLGTTPAEYAAVMKSDLEKWERVGMKISVQTVQTDPVPAGSAPKPQ